MKTESASGTKPFASACSCCSKAVANSDGELPALNELRQWRRRLSERGSSHMIKHRLCHEMMRDPTKKQGCTIEAVAQN